MKRLSIDTAQTAVKSFVRSLQLDADGVQLELDGKVVCEVLPPHSVSLAERATLVARARALAQRARERNQGIPARVIEREVQRSVDEVRARRQR